VRDFVSALHDGTLKEQQIFVIQIKTGDFSRIRKTFKAAFASESTWPFYGLFLCLLSVSRMFFP
jgi:hypothetical protein